MNENFLLKTKSAQEIYESVRSLPIIDFHNHICVADVKSDRKYDNIVSLWLSPDPYKYRLMRICGVNEFFITGDAEPYEKFKKYCEIFPFVAGNPVYDWSRMELSRVFGINYAICAENSKKIYDTANEMLASPEYSNNGIFSRFNIEYQSPVATLLEDLSDFDGKTVSPSLRADDLLDPSDSLKLELSKKSGITIENEEDYIKAVCVMLDKFSAQGCKFADHSLDTKFFFEDEGGKKAKILVRLGNEYAKRGWTLLLHINAKRSTSPRLRAIAGPAGGFAAVGESFDISALADLLGKMESEGGLPDTVIFPLNMSDQAPLAVLQGSFSENGVASKVQLGPAWWWCDHAFGIKNTLESIAAFGAVSQFIGMTTDSRSILSFVRHDYFRRLLCSWLDEKNNAAEWELSPRTLLDIAAKISYENAKAKILR